MYKDEGRYVCVSRSPRLRRNISAVLDVTGNMIYSDFMKINSITWFKFIVVDCVFI